MTIPPREPEEPDQEPVPLIELVPAISANDLPIGNKFEDRWVKTEDRMEPATVDFPVPSVPLHLCPTCDYNLTGLTARRCPECGEPFTLAEARDRAVEKEIGFRRYFASDRYEQLKTRVAVGLLVAGLLVPMVKGGGSTFWPQLRVGPRGGMMLVFLPIFLVFAVFYKVIRDTTWADALLVAGIGAAMLGAAVTFL